MKIAVELSISESSLSSFHSTFSIIKRRLNDKTLFDEIIESFKVMDKDNDGFLSRIELKLVLQDEQVGLKFIRSKIKNADHLTEE